MLKQIARQIPQIDRLVRSRDELGQHVRRLERENSISRNEINVLRDSLAETKRSCEELKNSCQISALSIDTLNKEVATLLAENFRLTELEASLAVPNFVRKYRQFVRHLLATFPEDEAMSLAVGGDYDRIGRLEVEILQLCGIADAKSIIDLGCGSGRLAKHIGLSFPHLDYLGIDIVPELLKYAAAQSPAHFRFLEHSDLTIPVQDASADFITAFSVFTHLQHEDTLLYITECFRVIRPGGKLVFSFIEFDRHWSVLEETARMAKTSHDYPLNIFIERAQVARIASSVGFSRPIFDVGPSLGQSVAILAKQLIAE